MNLITCCKWRECRVISPQGVDRKRSVRAGGDLWFLLLVQRKDESVMLVRIPRLPDPPPTNDPRWKGACASGVRVLAAGRGNSGRWRASKNRGVENGGNYRTEGFHRVKRSGSSEQERFVSERLRGRKKAWEGERKEGKAKTRIFYRRKNFNARVFHKYIHVLLPPSVGISNIR